jgi:sporulation protein YlmC with PRC-barrel domain
MGKKIYAADATFLGEIIDVGFTVGAMEPSLVVRNSQDSKTYEIPWEKVAYVKDIVLTRDVLDLTQLKQIDNEITQIQSTSAPEVQQPVQTAQPVVSALSGDSTTRFCNTCGGKMTWIKEYSRFYCYKCKKYA